MPLLNEIGVGSIDIFKVIDEIEVSQDMTPAQVIKLISDFEILDIYSGFLGLEQKFRTVFYYDKP